ncbi:MAG: hypothetical protein K9L98_03220 [Candidatus Pacebacteria bacterium]|nr:hypothetical protein [Candidatus Paceibacterota bacterium]MCF7862992.1 hypothetical protein [Candidatus Paceibacterota bacterium]
MKQKLILLSMSLFSFSLPMLSFAAQNSPICDRVDNNTLQAIICKVGELLNFVVPVLVGLGVVIFVWGVIMYVMSSEEDAKTKGRDRMIFGIVGLAVIVAMWGLVRILINTFDVGTGGVMSTPALPI